MHNNFDCWRSSAQIFSTKMVLWLCLVRESWTQPNDIERRFELVAYKEKALSVVLPVSFPGEKLTSIGHAGKDYTDRSSSSSSIDSRRSWVL